MGEGLEWPVIRDPKIVQPGEGSGGFHVFPTEIQEREAIDHGEIPRAEGHGAVIQLSAERGRMVYRAVPSSRRAGPDEHDPIVVGRGDEEFPAEEAGKAPGHGRRPTPRRLSMSRTSGSSPCRALDRWQHQRLEADGAVPARRYEAARTSCGWRQRSWSGRDFPGCAPPRKPTKTLNPSLCRREQIPGSQEFDVRDKENPRGHPVEESVPEDTGAVDDAVDPAITAGHLAQGATERLGVGTSQAGTWPRFPRRANPKVRAISRARDSSGADGSSRVLPERPGEARGRQTAAGGRRSLWRRRYDDNVSGFNVQAGGSPKTAGPGFPAR